MIDRAAISRMPIDGLADLDIRTDSLSDEAVMFIGYQRTKQVSRTARKAWDTGDTRPMSNEVRARRSEIVQGTLEEIWREYLPLRDYLVGKRIKPTHVADIGCGAGINDVFLARDHSPRFTLIDIEETEDQYHGWASSGAGYASLASARALLEENGVKPDDIETINPRFAAARLADLTPDLATSLYSCGFHYPIDEYRELFLGVLGRGGVVVLDLRGRYWRRRSPALEQLFAAGEVTEVYQDERSVRIAIRGQ